jgi:peptidoglycan/xylan/chitin deacetylase (PgdA/CDA1 family)
MDGTVYLMYHELRCDARQLCEPAASYARYAVAKNDFRKQLLRLQELGYRGLNVSQARSLESTEPAVAITFDDGCETDWIVALPLLQEFGFQATFYVVSGFIGQRRGYLSSPQLRDIAESGFEVGCHSRTHPNLTTLSAAALHDEIVTAKIEIEQMIGRRVQHFSCPGGFWSSRVARAAAEAGFETVATSRIGANSPRTDASALNRIAIYHDTSLNRFEAICRGRGLLTQKSRQILLGTAKKVLGERSYRDIRSKVIGLRSH